MARLVARFGLTRYEADEYYRLALDAYNKRNMEEALNNIKKAIETNPHRAEYYAAQGFFKLEHGFPVAKAEPDFDEALRRNPYEVLGNYGKGIIAFQKEQFASARDYFMKAWAAMPERPDTLYYLALVEHRLKNNQQALVWMQQTLTKWTDEDDREIKRRRRNAERWISEFERLIRKQNTSLSINPEQR